jgi:hypothetical protein
VGFLINFINFILKFKLIFSKNKINLWNFSFSFCWWFPQLFVSMYNRIYWLTKKLHRGKCSKVVVKKKYLLDITTSIFNLVIYILKKFYIDDLRDNKHESYRSSSSSSGGGSVLAFIIGPFLFILAFPILWFNERRYVIDQYRITHAF